MEFRKANTGDLEKIKKVYAKIVQKMIADGYKIWNEIYPTEFFEEDIKNGALYVLCESDVLISAFALYGSTRGDTAVSWRENGARALYLDRFGINADYQKKGFGKISFEKACQTARRLGADYLRLFAVDTNLPAISFYEKCGMQRADGFFDDDIVEGRILREYGYEIKL